MLQKKQVKFILILCVGILAACQTDRLGTGHGDKNEAVSTEVPIETVASVVDSTKVSSDPSPTLPFSTAYQDAVNLASGAFTLGQKAQSPDDWDLIVGRWEQAIEKLEEVPVDHQHYEIAQSKLTDYERNLLQAKRRLAKLQQPTTEIILPRPTSVSSSVITTEMPAANSSTSVSIIERRGGTPVIEVMFNGKPYPMILDTGASHTHITRAMANELGIQVLGQVPVATASNNRVLVDVGNVQSIRVGNINRNNIPVSIGDAVPVGLLGNDVYKDFDVVLQANSVEFQGR
ncbi:MAG: hypothetical protein F6K11_36700 [Leptolyngbya sp. SIO3F4]|nr:hypothetical protein [Leptolyngbya sp. SIO3F4]